MPSSLVLSRSRPRSPRSSPRPRPAQVDGLSRAQRNAMVGVIVLLHGAGAWGLWQVQEVREAVREVAPMFVSLLVSERPPEPVPPPPSPPIQPKPIASRVKPVTAPVIAAAPSPAAAAFTVPEAPPVPPAPPAPPEPPMPVVVAAPAPAPPAPPPPPKLIPASAVQYLEPPQLVYPRLSRRNGESGRVGVRVYIDAAGLPAVVQLSQSSGHGRLDDAAVDAVRKARFKPYTENGQPTAGWATIALEFELEK